jgi:amino acid adenylation domain-containing protein
VSVTDRISALTPEQRALFERLRTEQQKKKTASGPGRAHQPPPIPRLSPPDGAGDWPLSYDQERMWALYYLDPQGTAYNIDTATLLKGPFRIALFRRALAEIVRRHGAWRTVFAVVDGAPVQRVLPRMEVPLPLVDLTALPAERRRPEALAVQAVDGRTPFDLERGPLVRTALLKLAAEEHLFLVTVHHIVTDWVTFQLLWRELAVLYEAYAQGRPSPLPEPPVHYSDYAVWQRQWMAGEVLDDLLGWWREQLRDMPLVLDLPTDRPRPAVNWMRGGQIPLRTRPGLAEAVHALARREGLTPFMAVLAVEKILLHLFSGQEKVLLGSNNANRNRPEIESVLGFFLTQVVFATDLGGDPTVREVLGRVRRVALGAYAHQDLPFLKLIEGLQPERDASRQPVVQALALLLDGSHVEHKLATGSFEGVHVFDGNSRYDLMFGFWALPDSIFGAMEYNSDLFDASTAVRLGDAFLRLLEAAAADPGLHLSQLPFLSEAARHQLLAEWNDVTVEAAVEAAVLPEGGTVLDRLAARVAADPEAPALVFAQEMVRFGDLDRAANRLAWHLRGLGVGRESRVALFLQRSPELVTALLAVWKAGGATVVLDPALPNERLAVLLADARPAVLVHSGAHGLDLPAAGARRLDLMGEGERIALRDEAAPPPLADASSLAYLIYTSGTTGTPKAVLVEHGSLVHTLDALVSQFAFGPGDRMPHVARFSFDISLFELLAPLLGGGACEILTEEEVLEPRRLLAALAQATRVHAVPSLMRQIAVQARENPLPGLRTIFTGGDLVPPDLVAELLEVFPQAEIVVLYGPTEAAIVCSAWRVPRGGDGERSLIGRPLPGVRFLVLDRLGRIAPLGVPGELCAGGPGVARGYFHREELTAEKFFARDGLRWYRTGDLVRWLPDGNLEFLGRTDGQVKIRGFRVEPGEVEAALALHPAVREAVVVARSDGRGEKRLVAYVVPETEPPSSRAEPRALPWAKESRPVGPENANGVFGGVVGPKVRASLAQGNALGSDWGDWGDLPERLREHLAARLPAYMIPSAFVILPDLPLTAHGKVDRGRLPEPQAVTRAAFEPPRTPTEERVAEVWREVLGLPQVGRQDDFFDLGGHSLLATQAMIRLRESTGVELPVRLVFQAPTLAEMAAAIEDIMEIAHQSGAPAAVAPPLVPVPRDGSPLPLSFAQERLWFLDKLAPGSPAYNLPLALRIDGPLDAGALARAFAALVRRHEALRTTFAEQAGKPVQVIAGSVDWELEVADLSLFGEEAEAEARRRAAADAVRPFDLAQGPLLRAALLKVDEYRHVLLLAIHHIVSDAWSMGVLVSELTALYAGEELPPLPVQAADHAVWQRAWLGGGELDRQLGFWRDHLAGAPAHLDLPADRPRPPVQSLRGGRVPVALPADLSGGLSALARSGGATVYMAVLAAWDALLSRLSGQRDVVVGTAVANRDRPELERLIGFFVNTLALRVDLSGDPAFGELVERGRRTVLDAFAHRDLPFEKLVEEMHPARDRSRQPVFQGMLTFQNVPPGTSGVEGLALTPLEVEADTAKLDLTLSLYEEGGRIQGTLEYASDLFERATAERWVGHFQTLIGGAVAAPAARLSELPLLSAAERAQLLEAWNRTAADFPREATVHGLFAEQAARTPRAVAAVHGEQSLTYGELARRAERLARRLLALGVAPEERVGLCAGRSLGMITALLGILEAGAAYLPLDPSYPPERLAWMLADAGATVLLAERRLLAEVLTKAGGSLGSLRVLWLEDLEGSEGHPEGESRAGRIWAGEGSALPDPSARASLQDDSGVPLPQVPATSLAYVMYTSGSTGTPKGVAVTHRNVVRLVRLVRGADYAEMGPEQTWLQFAPVSFDAATLEIWAPLLNGGRLALFPGERASLDDLGAAIGRYGITSLWLTAGLFHQMVDHNLEALRPLRQLLAGGDVVSAVQARRALEALPGLTLLDGYGPTEGTTFTCTYRMTDPRQVGAAVPIGSPVANARVYAVDDGVRPVPVGVAGELWIGGEGLARGYLGRPDLTAERFVPDPFGAAGERLYRTGDRVRFRPDGALEFLGRLDGDGQVKIRGFRIETGEIEAALESHPAVRQAAVLARGGEAGSRELVACVVPAEPVGAEPAELQRFLRTRLPEPMIPAAWIFPEALPLTPNGKVDRRALAGLAGEVRAGAAYVAPRTPLEEHLVAACAQVLGLDPEKVSVRDNFFDLGGHSLLATQLLAQLRLEWSLEIPLQLLFDTASLADLAERITEQELAAVDPELLQAMLAEMGEEP